MKGTNWVKKNGWSIYLWIVIVLSVITIIPLLQLAVYNHPSADDYSYAVLTYHTWQETHSIWEVLKGAWTTSIEFWNTWQGLYTSAFILALQPAIFGEKYYVLTAYFTLGAIYGGNLIFLEYLLHKKLGTSRLEAAALACVVSSLMIQWMPSGVEGIYWYNGAMNYTFFFGLMLVCICMMVGLQAHRNIWKNGSYIVVTALSGALLVGGNHVTALMGIVFAAGIFVVAIWKKEKQFIIGSLVVLCSMLTGFWVNVTSPGTAVRQAALGERMGITATIEQAVLWGMHYMDEWIGIEILICMALMFPLIMIVVKKMRERYSFEFRYPLFVLIGSVAWICVMFCPPLCAMGGTGAGRLQNVIYFSFVMLMFINEFYLCGWLDVKVDKENTLGEWAKKACVSKMGVMTVVVLLTGLGLGAGKTSNAINARNELVNGEAQIYSDAMYARYELFCDSAGQDVRVEGLWVKPELLFFSDITTDSEGWPNTSVRDYFDLKSVAIY